MASGLPPDPPAFGPGSPGYGPGGRPPPSGPQSPAPGSPSEEPAPPAAPSPSPPSPPYVPPAGPEAPGVPPAPGYGGPVPPGGWQQPPSPRIPAPPRAPLASWGSRLGAYAIDGLVVTVPSSIVFFLVLGGGLGVTGAGDGENAILAAILAFLGWLVVLTIILLLYGPLLMARAGERNGQTWGKQVAGIRAVRDNGEPWGYGSAALREVVLKNIAVVVASFIIPIPFLPWFLNFFWPLWDDQNRALHDMAASSHVVRA